MRKPENGRFLRSVAASLGNHPDVGYSLNNLGWFLPEEGNWAAAEPFLREGVDLNRKTLGDKHPRVAAVLNNWARVLQESGDYKRAEESYQQALSYPAADRGR